jgi:hypothetical protein
MSRRRFFLFLSRQLNSVNAAALAAMLASMTSNGYAKNFAAGG